MGDKGQGQRRRSRDDARSSPASPGTPGAMKSPRLEEQELTMGGIKSLFEEQKLWINDKLDNFKQTVKTEMREEFEAAMSQEREARILLENRVKELTQTVESAAQKSIPGNRAFPAASRRWAPPGLKETNKREELTKRTVVVGNFPRDTKREVIVGKIDAIIKNAKTEGADQDMKKRHTP